MEKVAIYIPWHYSKGLEYFVTIWLSYFDTIVHYFSLPLLIRTVFAPWKRLIDTDETTGFDLSRIFQRITFNLVSRTIGAFVRLALFATGLLLIIFVFLSGILGLIAWFIIPILGIPLYTRWIKDPQKYVNNLYLKATSTNDPIQLILQSDAGQFMSLHMGIASKELNTLADKEKVNFAHFLPKSFEELIRYLVDNNVWSREVFRKYEFSGEDLLLAASLWDKKREDESLILTPQMGTPGIGLELMFGYTPTLNQYSEDLSAPRSYSHRLIGREEVVSRIERTLNSGNSVVLIGQPGVGKKTVILEFAHRARVGLLGQKMAYRRVLEFDHNALLSSSIDLNQKKSTLSKALIEAAYAGNIILMIRDLHRLISYQAEGVDFTDVFDSLLERRDLKLIVVATNAEYEKYIAPNMRLRKYLETIEVTEPSKDDAMQILLQSAARWERQENLTIAIPALRKIINESDNFVTETPFPEKALEILDAVVHYHEQKDAGGVVGIDEVNKVFTEKTGISLTRLSAGEKKKLGDLEEIIHKSLVNQEVAISLIAKSLRARTVGGGSEDKPLGSFLFLGPTGVGKTETAKVLSKVYYGGEEKIIRFDMAEYAGEEGYERLIGSVTKNQPGVLTSAIKNRPASLLLLDEFEKATPQVFNLFLRLLDEGKMTDAFGKVVLGRHLFIIGTSNAGAEYIRELVSQGVSGEELQKKVVDHVLQKGIYSPEFLNRFDGVVVYEPLKQVDLAKIARMQLMRFSNNLLKQNIYLDITEEVCEKIAKDGYDPAFGARPMSRIVNIVIGDLFGRALIKGEIDEGSVVRIIPGENKDEFSLEKLSKKQN